MKSVRTTCRRVACFFAYIATACAIASIVTLDPQAKAESIWAVIGLASLGVMVFFIAVPGNDD